MPRRAVVGVVGAGAVAWWVARRRPFRVAVSGSSMAPTLMPGDYLVAVRAGPFRRGALVVVEHPLRDELELVKRLDGLPGDVVEGRALQADQHWVLGDDASASTDSRSFGPVGAEAIRGVVRLRYWPPGRIRLFR